MRSKHCVSYQWAVQGLIFGVNERKLKGWLTQRECWPSLQQQEACTEDREKAIKITIWYKRSAMDIMAEKSLT